MLLEHYQTNNDKDFPSIFLRGFSDDALVYLQSHKDFLLHFTDISFENSF